MPDVLSTPPSAVEVPWFYEQMPTREEGAVYCSALFAACAVLAELAGITAEQTDAVIQAAVAAVETPKPVGTTAVAELDAVLVAARSALPISRV